MPPKNLAMAARAPAAWSGLSSTLTTRPAGPTARTSAMVSAPEPVPASSTVIPSPMSPQCSSGPMSLGYTTWAPRFMARM